MNGPSQDAIVIAEAIKAGLREVAESILEAAKEQHRTDDPDRYCGICGSYAHYTRDHVCEDCGGTGHEDKYDEACSEYEPPEPYKCSECDSPEGMPHNNECSQRTGDGIVHPPSLLDSFPYITVPRGGLRFERVDQPVLLVPETPGAPPPELPEELKGIRASGGTVRPYRLEEHLGHVCSHGVPNPELKVGDTIAYDGREFKVTHVSADGHYSVEPFVSADGTHIVGPNYNTELPEPAPPRVIHLDETSGSRVRGADEIIDETNGSQQT